MPSFANKPPNPQLLRPSLPAQSKHSWRTPVTASVSDETVSHSEDAVNATRSCAAPDRTRQIRYLRHSRPPEPGDGAERSHQLRLLAKRKRSCSAAWLSWDSLTICLS
jgi:hypothetical protein